MSSHSAASFYLAGMLAVGIGSGALLKPGLTLSASIAACLLLLLLLGLKGVFQKAYWILAGLSFMGLGVWCSAIALPQNQPDHYLNHIGPEVESLEISILETLKPGRFALRYSGKVVAVDNYSTKGKILIEIRKDSALKGLVPGQHIYTPVHPNELTAPANPGGFDYGSYLRSLGIHSRLKLSKDDFLLKKDSGKLEKTPLRTLRLRLLQALEGIGLGRDETHIGKALLLGDRTGIDPDLHTAYKKAGVLHLLAISGLHIGVLATFLFTCLSPVKHFRFGKALQPILGLSFLWGYALITGFSPSVVRAVVLYSFVALALYLERPGHTLHFLGLAWIFMLTVIDPNWLLQVGFQLSFAAVAAIVVFYPFLIRFWPLKTRPWNYFGKLIAVSLAAQLGTLPFTLYYFHQFPGLFLLSNLVLLPGIGVVLVLGLACLSLEVLSVLPAFGGQVLNKFLWAMNHYVQWASGKEVFFVTGISLSAAEFLLSATAVFLLGIYLRTRYKKTACGIALMLVLFQGAGIAHRVIMHKTDHWIIPHQVANTMVWFRQGVRFEVFTADTLASDYPVIDAMRHWDLDTVKFSPLSHRYSHNGVSLRVLDRSGLYAAGEPSPDYLLLSGSPNVHLGRLLQALRPAVVIADGSNYTSDLERWARSCAKKGIPFHATAWNGAFELKATKAGKTEIPRKK